MKVVRIAVPLWSLTINANYALNYRINKLISIKKRSQKPLQTHLEVYGTRRLGE